MARLFKTESDVIGFLEKGVTLSPLDDEDLVLAVKTLEPKLREACKLVKPDYQWMPVRMDSIREINSKFGQGGMTSPMRAEAILHGPMPRLIFSPSELILATALIDIAVVPSIDTPASEQ